MMNRADVRATLIARLRPYLTSAREIRDYGYDFQTSTPVVTVRSAGSDRPPWTSHKVLNRFRIKVEIWTARADPGWTVAGAEAKADEVEMQLANFVEAQRSSEDWRFIAYDGMTTVDPDYNQNGVFYIHETAILLVTIQ